MTGLTTRQLVGRRTREFRSGRKDQLQPGDMLQDRYRIIGTLGQGGFSSVYQARDMRFRDVTRLCAVKEMVNLAANPELRELTTQSFIREANILATLDHPAIPEVYDYFSVNDRSYMVLEFIRGKDLEALLAETTTFIPQTRVQDWALQICDVLSYLHRHQPQPLVFRDLKPSNIMLDPHNRIRLIDFGIAKIFEVGEKGTMIGTEGYSPPEQYRGEASPAGDVYALGATLHHLLTRQDPRLETPFTFAERPISGINPEVSPAFEAVIMRCLSYDVSARYPNAVALMKALQEISQPQGAMAFDVSAGRLRAGGSGQRAGELSPVTPGLPGTSRPSQDGGIKPIWKFRCEDELRAAPAVADGMVYIGAYDHNLYALRADSGEFVWKYAASSSIAAAPTTSNDAIYFGSADRSLYSVRRFNGRLNWRFAAKGPIYSSPRVQFEHIFFGSDDGHLYAINVNSGREVWNSNVQSPIRSSACFSDDRIIFGTEAGVVIALDLRGQPKWQFQAKRAVTSSPAIADDLVFFGSWDSTVYAVDATSGWAIWRFRAGRAIVSSPVIHEDALFIGSSDGCLYALSRHSGQKLWTYETDGQIASTPAVWEDAVYFGGTDGAVYSVDAKKGTLRWRFQTEGLVVSSPVIVDGVVYIGSADHHIYALPA